MLKRTPIAIFPALLILISGCNFFAPETGQQTLAAEHGMRGTEIVLLRETATAASGQLNGTLQIAQTVIAGVEIGSTRIAATLIANGMPFVDARNITPAPSSPDESIALAPLPVGTTVIGPTVTFVSGGAQGNITIEQSSAPTPLIVPNSNTSGATPVAPIGNSGLSNLQITDAVGADDCPVGNVSAFDATADGVYITAIARDIDTSNTVTARFLREGTEAIFYTWSPSFYIEQGCIWFYMPSGDVDFTAGSWSATLELDGQTVGSALMFTINGGDAMDTGV